MKFSIPFAAAESFAANPGPELGTLPEWNLDDLYAGMDAPAFTADLARAASECKAFAALYRGKLLDLAEAGDGAGLLAAGAGRFSWSWS